MRILIEWRLWDNPKLARLADLLGRNHPETVGLLVRLWGFTAEFRPGGSLEGMTAKELAQATKWRGSPDKLLTSLRKSGWLDGMQVHEWQGHQGKFIEKMEADRIRKRRAYEARRLRGESAESPGETASAVSVSVSVSDTVSVSKGGEENAPSRTKTPPIPNVEKNPQQERDFGPAEEAERQIVIAINQAKLIGTASQKREFAQGWRASCGGAATLEILAKPEIRGRDIFEVHKEFFRQNGHQKGSVDRLLEWARGEDRKREAKDASKS